MRYVLSGSIAALSFSLTDALNLDRFEGCASVITRTHTVYATAAPPSSAEAAVPTGASEASGHWSSYGVPAGSHTPGASSSAGSYVVVAQVASSAVHHTAGGSYPAGSYVAATHGASSAGTSSAGASSAGARGPGASYPAGSYVAWSSSSAQVASSAGISTPCTTLPHSAPTGSWSSYSVPFANASTPAHSYSAGVSDSPGVSSVEISSIESSSTEASSTASSLAMVSSSAVSLSTEAPSISAAVSTSTEVPNSSAIESSALATTESATPTSSTSATFCPLTTTTATLGPNLIGDGNFEEDLPTIWKPQVKFARINVGDRAKSPPFVLQAKYDSGVPLAYVEVDLGPAGPFGPETNYTLSWYGRIVSSTFPADASFRMRAEYADVVMGSQFFSVNDVEKGWQKFELKDYRFQSPYITLTLYSYAENYPDPHFDADVEIWVDNVGLYEQDVTTITQPTTC